MGIIFGVAHSLSDKSNNARDTFNNMCDFYSGRKNIELEKILSSSVCMGKIFKQGYNNHHLAYSEDKNLIVIFDGNIYGFKHSIESLVSKGHVFKDRSSPAEFILHSYEEYEFDFLDKINGIFGIALLNSVDNEVILANDKMGFYPIYINLSKSSLAFSSIAETILTNRAHKFDLDYDAIADFFYFKVILGGKTFWKEIVNLQPATIFRWKDGEVYTKSYYSMSISEDKGMTEAFFKERLHHLFLKSLENITEGSRNVKVSLSGGLDSRMIIGGLLELGKGKDIESETYFYVDERKEPDAVIAEKLSKKMGFKHKSKKLFNVFYDFDWNFKIAISGSNMLLEPDRISGYMMGGILAGKWIGREITALPEDVMKRCFHNEFFQKIAADPRVSFTKEFKGLSTALPERRKMLFKIRLYMRSYFNLFAGINSPRPNKLFLGFKRYPFLDIDILELIFSAPFSYFNYDFYLGFLKEYFPEVMKIEHVKLNHLPENHEKVKRYISRKRILSVARESSINNNFKRLLKLKELKPVLFYEEKFLNEIKNIFVSFGIWYESQYLKHYSYEDKYNYYLTHIPELFKSYKTLGLILSMAKDSQFEKGAQLKNI